jgi:superfamily I DNA/RNA helicase
MPSSAVSGAIRAQFAPDLSVFTVFSSRLEHREAGIDLKRQAVLFRASHHSDQLEVELARLGIPSSNTGG